MFVAIDGKPAGILAVSDPIRPTAKDAVAGLKALGLKVIMATGDNRVTAEAVARELGVDAVNAEVLPEDKSRIVADLRKAGAVVAMAGDGVNDAPALAAADVGIAMGAGADVAVESAGITLMGGDLRGVVRARRLATATMRNIRQNLFFAFAYNALGIPLAAGVLYPVFGLLLSPMIAAAAMSFSSVSVIGNALRLRKADDLKGTAMTDSAGTDLADRSALALRSAIADGDASAIEVAEALLARIARREPEVGAFAFIDPERVRAEARAQDQWQRDKRPLGRLHGLPVAVKDIIDTAGMPTENGTPLDAGRVPARDAAVVARLRQAGAIVLGKTVTTELGAMHPRGTRNPHNPAHTPGGSSSGSAAAVAAGMAPLAIGTQTNGSVIRPASFCGIVGFKPTFGTIARTGILPQATPLDTVGVFARSLADAALLVDALAGRDPSDPDSSDHAPHGLLDAALSPATAPAFAFVKTPSWPVADEATRAAFEGLAARLGDACREETLPPDFADAIPAHTAIAFAGIARHYGPYYDRGRDQLSDAMRRTIEAGREVLAVDYLAALDLREALYAELEAILESYDAILTPAAPGEAPAGLGSTGNPAFNTLWSLCGMPAVSLPLLTGPTGLPVGVQLVGRRGDDARLLRAAAWLMRAVG